MSGLCRGMASGFGNKGQVGRCYPVFQEFSDCVKASNKDTFRAACKEFRDDYMECLHHNKEILRLNAMDAELSRKKAAGESIPTLLAEDVARGEMKLPYTNIGK